MIAFFDDALGTAPSAPLELPLHADAVAAALELCEEARNCLIRAAKAVGGLYRAAMETGDTVRSDELRELRTVLWESRALVEARIITLRQTQSALLTPLE